MADSSFSFSVDDEQTKLVCFFRQRTILSVYAQHVLDFVLLSWQAKDPPAWLPTLTSELVGLQGQAAAWFSTTAPSLTQLPQNYIDVANSVSGQMPQLTAVMNRLIADPSGPSSDQDIESLTTLFNALGNSIRHHADAVGTTMTALTQYGDTLARAIKAMTEGAQSITAAVGDEGEAIRNLGTDIDNLHAQLASDVRALIGTGVTLAAGLVGLAVSIGLTAAGTVTGAVAGLGILVAACVAIAGIVSTGLLAASVVADQQAIVDKQAQLSVAGQRLVELNGLSTTVNAMLTCYNDPMFKLTPLAKSWTTLADELQGVRDMVIAERTDAKGLKDALADLQNLNDRLQKMSAFGTQLQKAALSADGQPTEILTISIAQAA